MQAESAPTVLQLSPAEQAVWRQEEAYWRFVHSLDWDSYAKLWDERFAGWPSSEPVPVHKDKVQGRWQRKVLDYELEPLSVRQYGDNVVIVFYRATDRSTDLQGADEQTCSFRITHTWMRTAEGWKIVGGMAAVDQPPTRD